VEAQQAAGANLPGLRPTPDRVRETLFNWLGQDLSGWRVLDAFAGSGALGFEAASRGAARCCCWSAKAARGQPAGLAAAPAGHRTAGGAHRRHALDGHGRTGRFELVLVDPPFRRRPAGRPAAVAAPLVAPGGFLYVESAQALAQAPSRALSLAQPESRCRARAAVAAGDQVCPERGYTARRQRSANART
jgi:16S rRNA (guanine966-N2)-methyltransferase